MSRIDHTDEPYDEAGRAPALEDLVLQDEGDAAPSESQRQDDFIQLLTEAQPRLLAYISMLLGSVQEADNILQETNLILWKKSDQFHPGDSFAAWSRKIAYYKTLSFLRDRGRRRVMIDHGLLELAVKQVDHKGDERQLALRHCLSELDEGQLSLLRLRYTVGDPLAEISRSLGKSEGAVKMALRRVRLILMECISRRLEAEHA
ncbi:sigma-70 family RNA polymerase sigma factor [Botrimarina mediterranea]|uniref:RNA polymerase sigma factor CnrH n=1 Tax=Botrimarina mediterranea TaxID=2528022 RepID=A0A518K8J8_9BACT|nr:sigma-70 family RNA polymerase sigma factor [Botrimarina mediterranea]QDV74114.1 RNA polymerase sigma factor CnrH [Botrimarina mediterranea]QDV78744.1 RNA polymerase sigma factor CnrH [Planctomycetes bacterium K2D]